MGKFDPKNENCHFLMKLGTQAKSSCRTQWSYALFQILNRNTLFCKILLKYQNCQFKLKFGTKTNWNIANSLVMSTFSIINQKYSL